MSCLSLCALPLHNHGPIPVVVCRYTCLRKLAPILVVLQSLASQCFLAWWQGVGIQYLLLQIKGHFRLTLCACISGLCDFLVFPSRESRSFGLGVPLPAEDFFYLLFRAQSMFCCNVRSEASFFVPKPKSEGGCIIYELVHWKC